MSFNLFLFIVFGCVTLSMCGMWIDPRDIPNPLLNTVPPVYPIPPSDPNPPVDPIPPPTHPLADPIPKANPNPQADPNPPANPVLPAVPDQPVVQPCDQKVVYAQCRMASNPDGITGVVYFKQAFNKDCTSDFLNIQVNLTNVPNKGRQNRKHGFHVHENGDISGGCSTAGGHFNPFGSPHGGPSALKRNRHVGDFGNVRQHKMNPGVIIERKVDYLAVLTGPHTIIGRSIVLHDKRDDLGKGGNAESRKTGSAGGRLACCTIEPCEPVPDSMFTLY